MKKSWAPLKYNPSLLPKNFLKDRKDGYWYNIMKKILEGR